MLKLRPIRVLSKKYDDSLRDVYKTCLLGVTNDHVTLFSSPGLQYWDFRKSAWYKAQDGLIEIYCLRKWYNVWHICEHVSHTELMYVNIAMPVIFERDQLVWVDLDLDYRVHLDGSIERLDLDEFEQNRSRMRYPAYLLNKVQEACDEVEKGLALGIYPFDYERQRLLYKNVLLR